jgi:hypothetical protein
MHRHGGNMLKREIVIGVFANLLGAGLIILGEFVTSPYSYLAWLAAIVVWAGCSLVFKAASKHRWSVIKAIGYCFLPTTFLCLYLDERRAREELQTKLDRIQSTLHHSQQADPHIGLIVDLAYPERRVSALQKVLQDLRSQTDQRLAPILIQARTYASDMCTDPNSQTYTVFRRVIDAIPTLSPQDFQMTWDNFLPLLGDVFDCESPGAFDVQVKRDCVTCVQTIIRNVNGRHLKAVIRVIEVIMREVTPDHSVARAVFNMILDANCNKDIRNNILHNSIKRAFKYPHDFGYSVLDILGRLEHRVFWLDMDMLREIIASRESSAGGGIASLHSDLYQGLCRGVFAPLEDQGRWGLRHGRVFRRLQGPPGQIEVTCVLSDGKTCSCRGKSLSFRGFYTESCTKAEGERVDKLAICSIADPNRKFNCRAAIAPLHRNADGTPATGRGVLFEDAEESEVQRLYEYITSY